MATSALVTHCGARVVTREELDAIAAPAPTATWFPVRHGTVIDTVTRLLGDAGFRINGVKYAVARNDARMFAVMDLVAAVATGVNLAVGIRNSTDKSLPLGFVAGNHVFVCDNLCFRSELLVARKHTRFGATRFEEAILRATKSLVQFQEVEYQRIKRFQQTDMPDVQAESILLRAYEEGIVSHRLLPRVIQEWRKPSFEDFTDRTAWSLINAFTTILGDRLKSNPQQFAATTVALQALFDKALGATALVDPTAA